MIQEKRIRRYKTLPSSRTGSGTHCRALQTPVITYANGNSGATVKIVGTIHVGDPAYYFHLQEFLDAQESHSVKIVYEMVKIPSPTEQALFTRKEFEAWRYMVQTSKLQSTLAKICGLMHQFNGITYRPSWIHGDMDTKAIMTAYLDSGVSFKDEDLQALIDILIMHPTATRWAHNLYMSHPSLLTLVSKLANIKTLKHKALLREIEIDLRNTYTYNKIKALSENNHVAAVWGVAHIPGLHRLLTEDRWFPINVKWFDAYYVRNYPFKLSEFNRDDRNSK